MQSIGCNQLSQNQRYALYAGLTAATAVALYALAKVALRSNAANALQGKQVALQGAPGGIQVSLENGIATVASVPKTSPVALPTKTLEGGGVIFDVKSIHDLEELMSARYPEAWGMLSAADKQAVLDTLGVQTWPVPALTDVHGRFVQEHCMVPQEILNLPADQALLVKEARYSHEKMRALEGLKDLQETYQFETPEAFRAWAVENYRYGFSTERVKLDEIVHGLETLEGEIPHLATAPTEVLDYLINDAKFKYECCLAKIDNPAWLEGEIARCGLGRSITELYNSMLSQHRRAGDWCMVWRPGF